MGYSFDHDYLGALTPDEEWDERYGELHSRDDLKFFTDDALIALSRKVREVLEEVRQKYPHCPTPTSSEEVAPLIEAVDRFCIAYDGGKSWRELLPCAREVDRVVKESCFWYGDFTSLREDDGEGW